MSILIITNSESEPSKEYKALAESIAKSKVASYRKDCADKEKEPVNETIDNINRIHTIAISMLSQFSINAIIKDLEIYIPNLTNVLVEDDVILSTSSSHLGKLPAAWKSRIGIKSKNNDFNIACAGGIYTAIKDLFQRVNKVGARICLFGEAGNIFLASTGCYMDLVPSVSLYASGVYTTNIKHSNGRVINVHLDKNKLKTVVFPNPKNAVVYSLGSLNGTVLNEQNVEIELPLDLPIPFVTTNNNTFLEVPAMFSLLVPSVEESLNINILQKLLS